MTMKENMHIIRNAANNGAKPVLIALGAAVIAYILDNAVFFPTWNQLMGPIFRTLSANGSTIQREVSMLMHFNATSYLTAVLLGLLLGWFCHRDKLIIAATTAFLVYAVLPWILIESPLRHGRGFEQVKPLALAFASGPLIFAAAILVRSCICRPIGSCSKCRYDLTGNISGKCPECGNSISSANRSSATPT